jgi:dienelactone hydrolase
MAQIARYHSVLGIRPGVLDAARRLRGAGHEVEVVDQYDGRVFDDYDEASRFAESVGYGPLTAEAVRAVEQLPDGFIAMGFSNGGGMSEWVASRRTVSGVVMLSGAASLEQVGMQTWPHGVPAQVHYTLGDPYREQAPIDGLAASIEAASSRTRRCQASTTPTAPSCSGDGYSRSATRPGARRSSCDPSAADSNHARHIGPAPSSAA